MLDQVEFEKVNWYRVRAYDEAKTEGWIEAQHVITNEVLEKSKTLAEEFKTRVRTIALKDYAESAPSEVAGWDAELTACTGVFTG